MVATKADKLSRAQTAKAVQTVSASLAVGRDDVIVFSGLHGTGKEKVESVLEKIIAP